MGDIAPDGPIEGSFDAQHDHREVKVLVTGYAPFHVRFPVNSSWSIASTLPGYLPATRTCPRIKLLVPSEPIKVAYQSVINWEEERLASADYDVVLHIGLAAGRRFFTMERQSPREPYWEKKDVDGKVFSKEMTAKLWPAAKFPAVLTSTFDCDDVWRRWRDNVNERLDVRPSDDPGNYLCGFIYYYSMAWFWGRNLEERPVMFLHVPDLPTEELVDGGRQVAIGLIRALVESREKNGVHLPIENEHTNAGEAGDSARDVEVQDRLPSTTGNAAVDDLAWTYQS